MTVARHPTSRRLSSPLVRLLVLLALSAAQGPLAEAASSQCIPFQATPDDDVCTSWLRPGTAVYEPAVQALGPYVAPVSRYYSLFPQACRDAGLAFTCASAFRPCTSASPNGTAPCASLCTRYVQACEGIVPSENLPNCTAGDPLAPGTAWPSATGCADPSAPVNLTALGCPSPFLPTESYTINAGGPACAYPCQPQAYSKSAQTALYTTATVLSCLAVVFCAIVIVHFSIFNRRFPSNTPLMITIGLFIVAVAFLLPLMHDSDRLKTYCRSPTEVADIHDVWCALNGIGTTLGVQWTYAWMIIFAAQIWLAVWRRYWLHGWRDQACCWGFFLGWMIVAFVPIYRGKIVSRGLSSCTIGQREGGFYWSVWFDAGPAVLFHVLLFLLLGSSIVKQVIDRGQSHVAGLDIKRACILTLTFASFAPLAAEIIIYWIDVHLDSITKGVNDWIACKLATPDACTRFPQNQLPLSMFWYLIIQSGIFPIANAFILMASSRTYRRWKALLTGKASWWDVIVNRMDPATVNSSGSTPDRVRGGKDTSEAASRRTIGGASVTSYPMDSGDDSK